MDKYGAEVAYYCQYSEWGRSAMGIHLYAVPATNLLPCRRKAKRFPHFARRNLLL